MKNNRFGYLEYSTNNRIGQEVGSIDYVELEQKDIGDDQDLSVSSELDLILLDMDDDDENDDNPFGEELDDDYDEIELDEYEYEDLDPELFEDPTLLVKWLERRNSENDDDQ